MTGEREGWVPVQQAWLSGEDGRERARIVMEIAGSHRTFFQFPEKVEKVIDLAVSQAKPESIRTSSYRMREDTEEEGTLLKTTLHFQDAATESRFRHVVVVGVSEYLHQITSYVSPDQALEAAGLKMDREAQSWDDLMGFSA